MTDEQLAERLARADAGEEFWARVTDHYRAHAAAVWRDKLSTIRRAGLALVEAEAARNWRAERRERIATAALRALLASVQDGIAPDAWAGSLTCTAVVYADALIAALDKESQP